MALSARIVRWGGPVPRFENARGGWTERHGLRVVLEEDQRVVGLGEAAPLPGYSSESIESAADALSRARWDELAEVELTAIFPTIRVPSACFAIETALLDRRGMLEGRSVSEALADAPIREPVARAPLLGTLGDAETCKRARRARAIGVRAVKLKARGSELERECEALRSLGDALGPDIEIRLDLNGSLGIDAARRVLDAYRAHRVAWVEEPVRGAKLLELGTSGIPWLADESLVDPTLANELLDCAACAGVVLKPTLLGLVRAFELGRSARGRGKLAIVSHTFEGPIALAANAELALALGSREACGVDRHDALSAFSDISVPQLEVAPALIYPSARSGLGLSHESRSWP